MICEECEIEMTEHEILHSYLVPLELEYQCPRCGKIFNIKKAYNEADNDVITIKHATDYAE